MAGLRPHLEHGPESYLVAEDIVGGTFVMAGLTTNVGKVVKATAGSFTVLGLALGDAAAVSGMVAGTLDTWGRNIAGVITPPNEVAVAYRGSWWIKNTTGGLIPQGTRLIAGAAGVIAVAGAAPDSRTVIGIVIEPAGIANNAEGRVRLTLT